MAVARRVRVRVAVALIVAVLSCPGTLWADVSTTKPTTHPADSTHIVQKGRLKLEIQTEGVLQAVDPFEVRLRFRAYQGALSVLTAMPHAAIVKKGDVLLEFDPAEMNWAVEGAQNALESARANLRKATVDRDLGGRSDALAMRIHEDGVRNAESGLKWWNDVDGPQMLLSADLQVKQVKDSVDDQNDELDQLRKMYKSEELTNATADIVIKRAVRRLQESKIGLKMTEERRDKTKALDYLVGKQKAIDALEQAKQALAALKATQEQAAVLRSGAISTAKVALQQAEQRLSDLLADRTLLSPKAPWDGLLLYSLVPEGVSASAAGELRLPHGEKLAAGQVVMRLTVPGKVRAEIPLTEPQAFWIEPGMKVSVTPAAFPSLTFSSTCERPIGVSRGGGSPFGFQLLIVLPDADPRLLPGMKASVVIDAGRDRDVLMVPLSAVSDGRVSVRHGDAKIEIREVKLGKSDGQNVEVRSGLAVGDEILLRAKK